MEKQSLKRATKGWIISNIVWWPLYGLAVATIIPLANHSESFASWPFSTRLILALLPALPVGIWLYMAGRFVSRSPDELGTSINTNAAATAGLVTVFCLFAAGWVETILQTEPISAWIFLPVAFAVWMLQIVRLQIAAR